MAGSIKKIGKKYRVTKELGKDRLGKRLREYAYAYTESEAKKILSEFEYNQQRNILVESNRMTVSEFLDHWMDNYVKYNCEETTAYGYRNILYKHVVPYLGVIELQKLQPRHIQDYYKYLMDEKGLSPNTVRKHHANIRKALDYGLKQQFVHRNVADAVSLPRSNKFEGKAYTKEQLSILLNLVKDTKLELPVYLSAYLGLRRSEITGLMWEKGVDMQNRILHIKTVRTSAGKSIVIKKPKTDKSQRTLYIDDEVYELLAKTKVKQDEYKKMFGKDYVDSGYVFTRDDGIPFRVNTVTEQFSDFLKKNNLPKIRLHDLRHTFASILNFEGVDLKSISEALGHSDIGTTNKIYTHLFDKTHRDTVSAMSRALRGQKREE
ncbi:tyrosine recombinase XerC [Paenibacillus sp. NPDC057934]|uniref:site-specific integrase n=1 Tax=Paenibacillus sp. NPDC057934 TaxID=3346282 RepID=UPI0036DC2223